MTDYYGVDDRRAIYTVTNPAGQSIFDIDFPLSVPSGGSDADYIDVFVDGVEQTSGFTVDASAATVTFSTAVAQDSVVTLQGNRTARLVSKFPLRGELRSAKLNNEFVALLQILQELKRDVNRQLILSPSQSDGADNKLPLLEANKALVVNPAGTGFSLVAFADLLSSFDTLLTGLASGDFLTYDGAQWVNKTAAQVRTALDVYQQSEVYSQAQVDALLLTKQALDATLTALAGVTVAADKGLYATGADAFSTFDLTSFGRSLCGSANAAAVRSAIGAQVDIQTSIATTSGTAVNVSGIPSGINRFWVGNNGVSTNGTDDILVQLGTSGGLQTSGYISGSGNIGSAAASGTFSTSGFLMKSDLAANTLGGGMYFQKMADHIWNMISILGFGSSGVIMGGGVVTLAGELSQLRYTVTGSDVLDAGSISLGWEY